MPWKMSLLVVASVALAAGEAVNGASSLDAWMRIGEFGFLAVFCWWGLTKVLPRMQKDFRTEAAESRKHHSEIVDKLVARQEQDRIATREVLQEMIKHCAEQAVRKD